MNEDRVRLTVEDHVAHLRLNRPADRNGIDDKMAAALAEAVEAIHADGNARALLISGEGPAFCVGGDLKFLAPKIDKLDDEFQSMIGSWHDTLPRFSELPIPVVSAIHGGTAGGGLGLVWCADFVIAAENTKIATGFVELGLPGDGGSSWHLPRLVGLRRAQELILDNRVLDAKTALEWGLVNQVVPMDQLLPVASALAKRLATRSLTAIAHSKERLRETFGNSYREQLQAEKRGMMAAAAQPDVKAGLPAFVAKTKPTFPDRPKR